MSFSPTQQHPQEATILVLELRHDVYVEAITFSGEDTIQSYQLGPLNLTAAEVFRDLCIT